MATEVSCTASTIELSAILLQNAFTVGFGLLSTYVSLMGFFLAASAIVAGYVRIKEFEEISKDPSFSQLLGSFNLAIKACAFASALSLAGIPVTFWCPLLGLAVFLISLFPVAWCGYNSVSLFFLLTRVMLGDTVSERTKKKMEEIHRRLGE